MPVDEFNRQFGEILLNLLPPIHESSPFEATTIHEFSADDCNAVASSLRESLDLLNVNKPALSSDLGRILTNLDWMGSFPSPPLRPGGAAEEDRDRAVKGFLQFEQAKRVALSLKYCRDLPGASDPSRKVTTIRKAFDRLTTHGSATQDILLEFEVAGRLRHRELILEFDEPDLRVKLPVFSGTVGLACKRPRMLSSMPNSIRDAVHQIETAKIPSIIVIGVEAILYSNSPDGTPSNFYIEATPGAVLESIESDFDRILQNSNTLLAVSRALDSNLLGVIFCTIATGFAMRADTKPDLKDAAYVFQLLSRVIPNDSIAGAPEIVETVRRCLH